MWNLSVMKFVTFILIHFTWTIEVSNAERSCSSNSIIPNWDFLTSEPPANLIPSLNNFSYVITVVTEKEKQDFCLSLFAVPLKKHKSECPSVLDESLDIRRHEQSFSSLEYRQGNPMSNSFNEIFTGCYYFVMSKIDSDKIWLSGPEFYETDYPFHDTRVRIVNSVESNNPETEIDVALKIPISCAEVRTALYETKSNISNDVEDDIKTRKISFVQEFSFTKIPDEDEANTTFSLTNTKSKVTVNITSNDTEWIASINWTDLSSEPGTCYYIRYIEGACETGSWKLLEKYHLEYLGEIPYENSPWIIAVGVVYFVGVPFIMAFCIVIYAIHRPKTEESD